MVDLRVVAKDTRVAASRRLLESARNVHSQFGEDGILEEIFRLSPPANRWCVEFGAWDGVHLSNTCNLIRAHGWKAVLIEGDPARQADIRRNHPDETQVHAVCAMVGFTRGVDTLDDILARTPAPRDLDLASIDVDGVDWHVWESMVDYRPRVVVVEFNGSIPNDVYFVQDRCFAVNEGCSVAALVELGRAKGYELAAVTDKNAIFVVREAFAALGIEDNSIAAMRADPGHFVFCGYNGKIYNTLSHVSGPARDLGFGPESLQFVSEFWFAGKRQGRAGPEPATDLQTAEGLLREVFELRRRRKELDPEEFNRRSRTAWAAVRALLMRR